VGGAWRSIEHPAQRDAIHDTAMHAKSHNATRAVVHHHDPAARMRRTTVEPASSEPWARTAGDIPSLGNPYGTLGRVALRQMNLSPTFSFVRFSTTRNATTVYLNSIRGAILAASAFDASAG
jgi:hypothetical protein